MKREEKKGLPFFGIPKLAPYLKPYKMLFFWMVVAGTIGSGMDAVIPLFQQYAINHFITDGTFIVPKAFSILNVSLSDVVVNKTPSPAGIAIPSGTSANSAELPATLFTYHAFTPSGTAALKGALKVAMRSTPCTCSATLVVTCTCVGVAVYTVNLRRKVSAFQRSNQAPSRSTSTCTS